VRGCKRTTQGLSSVFFIMVLANQASVSAGNTLYFLSPVCASDRRDCGPRSDMRGDLLVRPMPPNPTFNLIQVERKRERHVSCDSRV
jgi:hypothetical protein